MSLATRQQQVEAGATATYSLTLLNNGPQRAQFTLMKKEDLPQDPSALVGVTRDVCYVKDKDGKYTTDLSIGWDVKKQALDNAWEDIHERVTEAAAKVKSGEISPVFYFMEKKLMDLPLLSGYTGFWQWTIKSHFKP